MDNLYRSVDTLVAMVTRGGLSGNQTLEIQNRKVKPTVWGGGGYSGMLGIQRVLFCHSIFLPQAYMYTLHLQ